VIIILAFDLSVTSVLDWISTSLCSAASTRVSAAVGHLSYTRYTHAQLLSLRHLCLPEVVATRVRVSGICRWIRRKWAGRHQTLGRLPSPRLHRKVNKHYVNAISWFRQRHHGSLNSASLNGIRRCRRFVASVLWPLHHVCLHLPPWMCVHSTIELTSFRGVARGCGPHQAALARGWQIGENCKKKIHVKFQIVSFVCLQVQ